MKRLIAAAARRLWRATAVARRPVVRKLDAAIRRAQADVVADHRVMLCQLVAAATDMQVRLEALRCDLVRLDRGLHAVDQRTADLTGTARLLSGTAADLGHRTGEVAAAVADLSHRTADVAAAVGGMSHRTGEVAAAVADLTHRTADLTHRAARQAEALDDQGLQIDCLVRDTYRLGAAIDDLADARPPAFPRVA